MARGRARRTEVELVEDDDAATGTPPTGTPPTGTPATAQGDDDGHDPSRTTRRRLLTVGAALVAVLLVVGVAGQAVVTARERARVAALADVPGVLDPVDGSLEVLRTGPDDATVRATARTPAGLLVSVVEGEEGRESVRAVSPADGAVAWETELIGAGHEPHVPAGGQVSRSPGWCEQHGTDPDLLVCLADSGVSLVGRGTLTAVTPEVTRLVVLDAGTGDVVTDLSDAAGAGQVSRSLVVLDGLVVVAGAAGSTVHVRALATDWSVAWEADFPVTTTTAYGTPVELVPAADRVAVQTTDAVRLLDPASGRTLQELALAGQDGLRGTVGDALVVESGGETVMLRDDRVVLLRGTWVGARVDDGSVPGMVLTSDEDGLHAWDRDGDALWSSEQRVNGYGVLVMSGQVVVGSSTAVVALDVRTGAELWRTEGVLPDSGLVTDGRYVLVLAPRPGRSAPEVLVALGATDGVEAWRVTLPLAVDTLVSRHGVLMGYAFAPDGNGERVFTVLGSAVGDSRTRAPRARARARTARARRVEVELGDEPDDAQPRPGLEQDPATSSRHRWWWLAVPLAAALALVAGQVVTDRREAGRLAALADVPGVLAPLDGVAQRAWTVEPGTRLGGAVRVGGVVVVGRVDEAQAVALEGRDPATGARVWAADVDRPPVDDDPDAPVDDVRCRPVPDRAGDVACLVTRARPELGDVADRDLPAGRLLVLDAADGVVRTDREAPAWAAALTPVGGGDVVLVGAEDEDGVATVVGQPLDDGTEQWRTTVGEGSDVPGGLLHVTSTLLDPRTVAVGHDTAVTLVATGGAGLRTLGPEPVQQLTGRSARTVVVTSTALGAVMSGHRAGTTVASSTGEVRVDGSPLPMTLDDGSVPGLLLTRTPRLQAWDAHDGAARWEARVVDAQDATVLEGRVHVGTASAVVTFDGATGRELWRVPRPSGTAPGFTDGRHLYVASSREGRHSEPYDLVALHVADGSEAWRVPLPEGALLANVAGLLVLSADGTPTVLR